jgi:hypothetical protein
MRSLLYGALKVLADVLELILSAIAVQRRIQHFLRLGNV